MRLFLSALFFTLLAAGQADPSWSRPFPAHKIAGNLFYVGTEDLACYLITTPAGHILINTGLETSAPLIRTGIEKLGFRLEDVKILLTMQGHFDHMAAMHEIQKITGAKLYVTAADTPIVEDGGRSDPWFGKSGWFAPVKVSRQLKDGDVVALGGTELHVVYTPGHSKGSVSYTMTVEQDGKKLSVAIVNLPSVVMPLKGNPKYPNIVADFESSFARLKTLSPDIWVAGHASQFGMAAKYRAGSYVDPAGYKTAVESFERAFQKKLQAAGKP